MNGEYLCDHGEMKTKIKSVDIVKPNSTVKVQSGGTSCGDGNWPEEGETFGTFATGMTISVTFSEILSDFSKWYILGISSE